MEEAAHGAEHARDRARRQPLARERHDELRQLRLAERLRLAPTRLGASLQARQVAPVALDGVRGQPLLDLKIEKVFAYQVTGHVVSLQIADCGIKGLIHRFID